MAASTKQDLIRAFVELLNERQFDKISVTDVASRCGVSRNTFYYHFQDIFDLVDQMFADETRKRAELNSGSASKLGNINASMMFARANRTAIRHLYDSSSRPRLETYLYENYLSVMYAHVQQQARGLLVSQRDVDDLAVFYAAALEGVTMQWIRDGMRDETDRIANLARLLEGNIRAALERAQNS